VSHEGYDARNNGRQWIDYGNKEHMTQLRSYALLSPEIAELLRYLASYWPSLDVVNPYESAHCIEMQGDVMECVLAAFKGHDIFKTGLQEQLRSSGFLFGELSAMFCEISQASQLLTAYLVTGHVKHRKDWVTLLSGAKHLSEAHPFAQQWASGRPVSRSELVAALVLASAAEPALVP
jgi:hypothetical protein